MPAAHHSAQDAEETRKNFASDNVTPACSEVMDALLTANRGAMPSYGDDTLTQQLTARFCDIFEAELAVFPLVTGTAANAIALSALVQPYGSVLCDQSAHIHNDEGGAPEFLTGGAKLLTLPSPDGRMAPEILPTILENNRKKGVLSPPVQALSLTQATEWGAVYQPETLTELHKIAHDYGLLTHLDGARLGNAVAHLECTPAETTFKTGLDVLSFGGTKAGAMAAEAIVVFINDRTRPLLKSLPHLLKRSGHLWSKHRFLSAQLLALLEGDLWLKNARHANIMATRLAHGFQRHPAAQIPFEVQSNEVFVVLPENLLITLEEKGYRFYRQQTPEGVKGTLIRLVTSFYTRAEDVDAFLEDAHS